MKYISMFISILLVVILMLVILPTASAQTVPPTATPTTAVIATSESTGCDPQRSVQVSGTALVNVAPDRALIQLGVQTNGDTPSKVEQVNSSAIKALIKELTDLGIEQKEISTDLYYVEPVYSSYDSLNIRGYRINNTIAITLRDITKVNQVVSTALESGANQIVNVELYTSELRKYRDQAREMAVKAANEKASALADSAGAKTGCVLNIAENTYSYYNGWWGRNNNIWAQNVSQNVTPSDSPSAVSETGAVNLGQISVRAEVTVTYSLK